MNANKEDWLKENGKRLKECRRKAGLSQRDVEERTGKQMTANRLS